MKAIPNKIFATTYKMSLAELVRLYGIKKYKYVSWYFPVERYKQNSFLNNLTKKMGIIKLRKILFHTLSFFLQYIYKIETWISKTTHIIQVEIDHSSRTQSIKTLDRLSKILLIYRLIILTRARQKAEAVRSVETIHYKYFLIIKRE